MLDFLASLPPLLKGFWYLALISSVIFAIQSILTFIGGVDADGVNADFSGDLDHADAPFQLFSFRNVINFLLGFGWTGVVFYDTIGSSVLLVALAAVVGCLFVLLFFLLIRQLMKLSEDNTFKLESLLDLNGRVYIPIPERMSGKGQIQISVLGATHEIDAMTKSDTRLASGATVKVVQVENGILIVEKVM